ncbi:MAG: hypothetical protein LBG97_06890 [Coriobacteriales bacterium]|nr:hypothetical protein [Coriobacteriales bacterium]
MKSQTDIFGLNGVLLAGESLPRKQQKILEAWLVLKEDEIVAANSVYIDGSVCWSESLDIAPEELWHYSK